MRTTIKDIAAMTGVSIATVSHVINKTRYVSPDLVEKVELALAETGYAEKKKKNPVSGLRFGKASEIALIVPNTYSVVYSQLIIEVAKRLEDDGFILSAYFSFDDAVRECHILQQLMANRHIAGIILAPVNDDARSYEKLIHSGLPFICLERTFRGAEIDSIVSDNVEGIYKGTKHLIKSGHESIILLLENRYHTAVGDKLRGYRQALAEYGIPFREDFVINIDLTNDLSYAMIKKVIKEKQPTAFFAGGNTLTLKLLKTVKDMGLEIPKDISVVGYGDDKWFEAVNPPLTTLAQDTQSMADLAVERIVAKIENSASDAPQNTLVPVDLAIRASTQNIARGPFGEKVAYPEDNMLTDDEVEQVRAGNYRVAISFHCSGDDVWTRLHAQALRKTLADLNIKILSIADAHFDPRLQEAQLTGMLLQKPDAVIAVPVDEEKTSRTFKEVARNTKLVLINNMPQGFEPGDCACWISVNELDNGQAAAKILIDHFAGQGRVSVGLITHGTPFFATKQRDFNAEQMILENGPNLDIVAKSSFVTIDNTYDTCRRMMTEHPEIQGLYITWERPALQAMAALRDIGREDVAIVTTDLDYEISTYMARGEMVVGLSSQRPYDQGLAVATATAKVLLGKNDHRCVGVQPYTILAKNLEKAWLDILKTKFPQDSQELIRQFT